ncbi:methyltransferase [Orrella daihaiensis]|uniref:Methyltransferase n=1 Tax=Orrella daihaiensis TaxID=2782176 RepID=A0ABY4ANZ9_9BURK|nr:class I SAM-dependent methyltransferase [Orrella daihaiensis]UOD51125.1 methyltransferase [Orrella daihaiensis]
MQPTQTQQIEIPLPDTTTSVYWQSAHHWNPPRHIETIGTNVSAKSAGRALGQSTALLCQGDYQQARQLLSAIKRLINNKSRSFEPVDLPERFHRIRLQRSQAARQAGLLLVEIKPGYAIHLAGAPDAHDALRMAYGERLEEVDFVVPLSELVGVLSAFEWHRQGLPVAALGHNIFPRWGVFAPTRHEYLDLVMQAELPSPCDTAVDVGTGTGVLAMLLAKRGIQQVIATDVNPAALACATDNVHRANLHTQITILDCDLIPEGKFDLIVCNPPWLPGAASGPLEAAIYDPQHRMLQGFLNAVGAHLQPNGQAWLILSDLAEHLKLRSREDLLGWFENAGLVPVHRLQTKASHRKLSDTNDPLMPFRRAEITSLWQLRLSCSGETP